MALPLLYRQKVWGFIEINRPDTELVWTRFEQDLFQTASTIIAVCLTLSRAEEQAVQDHTFLFRLFENMPLGYARIKLMKTENGSVTDFIYRDINQLFSEIAGKNRNEIIGQLNSQIHVCAVTPPLSRLEEVATTRKVLEAREHIAHKKHFYDTTIYATADDEVVLLFSDVTHSVQTFEALRKGEEELNKVYAHLPVGIEIYDRQGTMIEVNDKELEIQKVPRKEILLGRNLFDHPSLPDFASEQLSKGKNVTFDVNIDNMKKNREYYGIDSLEDLRYLTIQCTILHNAHGEIENYLLIIVDNTEIYHTSLRLREFETAFNSVAEIAEMGFFRWNPAGQAYFGSEQFYLNMGFSEEEEKPLVFEDCLVHLHPEDQITVRNLLRKAIETRLRTFTIEFRVRQLTHWKWIRMVCHLTGMDAHNQIAQFTGINYNITEIKKAGLRLIKATHKAEESDRLKSAFLANMSQEIRTPVHQLIHLTEMLAKTTKREKKQLLVTRLKRHTDHWLHLMSDILELSRIEAGSMDLNLSLLRINELCTQELTNFQNKVCKEVSLLFEPDPRVKDPIICADPKWMALLLNNLVSNAVKFTAKGSVKLSYEFEEEGILFAVEDTGIGIDSKEISRLFQRFVKLDDTVPGTGLGLPICQSLVEKLGGRMGVESQPAKGSRFWFYLPLSPNPGFTDPATTLPYDSL